MSARIPRITTTVKQAPREGATCQYYLSNQGDQKMAKEIYGCACCSPEFGKIFQGNQKVAELSAMEGVIFTPMTEQNAKPVGIDRRSFLKGVIATAGAACFHHGQAFAGQHSSRSADQQQKKAETTTVFTGASSSLPCRFSLRLAKAIPLRIAPTIRRTMAT